MNEIKRLHKIEQQITKLCAEWCSINNSVEMDIVYLKDRVLFGEL